MNCVPCMSIKGSKAGRHQGKPADMQQDTRQAMLGIRISRDFHAASPHAPGDKHKASLSTCRS